LVRSIARTLARRRAADALATLGADICGVVAASAEPVLRPWSRTLGKRVYYATDDFVGGAELMGYSRAYMRRAQASNLRSAELALAVSQPLADSLRARRGAPRVEVLPNGCDADGLAAVPLQEPASCIRLVGPVAGVVGQLNDRLDIGLLEAVADRGDSLLLVGPRCERDSRTTRLLDTLIERPNVQWVGRQPAEALPALLAGITVGLTPYVDSEFNRASYPLKTLEYLAAGRQVVSTSLPATCHLDADLVVSAHTVSDFADAVHRALQEPESGVRVARRQAFAREHSWDTRARALLRLLGQPVDTTHPLLERTSR
jgi:glycosyltransferase involved in cell wall biosynthesis